mgnify:FL=1
MRKYLTFSGPYLQTLAITALLLVNTAAKAEPLLNGLAPHLELGQERFIAGLYVESLSEDAASIMGDAGHKRMALHVTAKRLSHRSLRRMWIEGMAINTPSGQLTKYAKDTVTFAGLFKSKLTKGDIILIDSQPGEGTAVSVNGVELGTLHTDGFFNVLLRTWIGSVPLSSDFRSQLLQNGQIDESLLAKFESIAPSTERIAAISEWTKPKPKPKTQAALAPEAIASTTISAPIIAPTVAAPIVSAPEAATETEPSQALAAAPETSPGNADTSEPNTSKADAPTLEPTLAATPAAEAIEDDESYDEEESEEPELTAESLIARQMYHSSLLRWAYQYLSYPKRSVQRGQEGSVRVSVTIDRTGKIKSQRTIEESKHSLLNREATKAVKKAGPFPVIPTAISGEEFSFTLPIVFRLPK